MRYLSFLTRHSEKEFIKPLFKTIRFVYEVLLALLLMSMGISLIFSLVGKLMFITYWDASFFLKRIYYVERIEISARLFEQYIAFKLKKIGIANSFLTDTKYTRAVYMTPVELKKVVPLFDKLLVLMRRHF